MGELIECDDGLLHRVKECAWIVVSGHGTLFEGFVDEREAWTFADSLGDRFSTPVQVRPYRYAVGYGRI